MRFLPLTATVASLGFLASSALAVGTRTFELDTLERLSGGDLKGVAVGSDGVVRAGFTLGNVPLPDATSVFSALPLADGSVLVGTSPNGKVLKVQGDQVSVFCDTKALAVTSLVQAASGVIYAATMPEGKIFKCSQGKADVFVNLPDTSHIWALALDKNKSSVFAATGPEGKVFRIEAGGQASVHYQSDEPQMVSVAVADNGDVYAGSSGKGLLYRITAPGRATVVYDFPGEEVKSIALWKGIVWAAGNEYGEPPEAPRKNPAAGRAQSGPTSTTKAKPGKGTLFRFDAQGRPEKMMHHDDMHYTALALDEQGVAYVGTGAEGRVYSVNDAHAVTLVADTDERQVGALDVSAQRAFVATSDGAVFHRVVARGGGDAVWTSKVLDAGLRAKYGVLSWRANGVLEMSIRTGNSAAPDATWSGWANPVRAPGVVPAAPGRYVQVRARWGGDPKAVLGGVTLPFVTDNVRPVVTEVSAAHRGSREGGSATVPASGGEPPKHESVVKVSWKVDNPDNDPLRYRVAFRREGQNLWRDALKGEEILTKSEFDWETLALPEGKYRVRIEASDEPSNPPDQVQKHALESPLVLVDNTPPLLNGVTLAGRRLKARAVDGVGPIARFEIAVDGKPEWRPLAAADGVFDSADEALDADVSAVVPPGSHIVAVRAFDAAGNSVVHEIESN